MGRRAKPTNIRKLEGNLGKRALNTMEPVFRTEDVKPPAFLDDYAREEWNRLAPSIKANGLLTVADLHTFAAYCQSFSDWRTAIEHIEKYGLLGKNGSQVIPSPFVSIRNTATKNLKFWACEFGLTPSSRSSITVDPADEEAPDSLAAHNRAIARHN